MRVWISVMGCDDRAVFSMVLNESEYAVLGAIAAACNAKSEGHHCQPKMAFVASEQRPEGRDWYSWDDEEEK